MNHCPNCGKRLIDLQVFCPACSHQVSDPLREAAPHDLLNRKALHEVRHDEIHSGDSLTVIARFQNAAEAGYFAHELGREEEFPVTIQLNEKFDAIVGTWQARFELTVPDSFAEHAAAALERLIDESNKADDVYDDYLDASPSEALFSFPHSINDRQQTENRSASRGVNWVPIVLTLAAGSAAFWGSRQFNQQAGIRGQVALEQKQKEKFFSQLSRSRHPWRQQIGNGPGVREFRIDRERKLLIFREDTDGDGLFESESVKNLNAIEH